MTTIILTIIGILLAAAAALMVIFYGGDAFNNGSVGAQANTLQNAGTNVISAVLLYKNDYGSNPASLAVLAPNYLKEVPQLGGISGAGSPALSPSGQFTVASVPVDVCQKINANLGVTQPATPTVDIKLGCAADRTFFANS